jgi:hypothetical protein
VYPILERRKMKTVLYEKVDGLEIITGFSRAVIDPVATAKILVDRKLKDGKVGDKIDLSNSKEEYLECAVYFEPRPGEEILKDKEEKKLITAFENLEKCERLLRNGKIISYLVGVKYWHKENGRWREGIIGKIGDEIPKGATTEPAAIEKQEILLDLNNQRIKNLLPEEKELEKNQQLAKALNASAIYKSELEILNDPDPLGKSKAQYEKLKKEIESRYS